MSSVSFLSFLSQNPIQRQMCASDGSAEIFKSIEKSRSLGALITYPLTLISQDKWERWYLHYYLRLKCEIRLK
jgi:hypothetical protein